MKETNDAENISFFRGTENIYPNLGFAHKYLARPSLMFALTL